jgi:hypothetical protein
MHSKVKNIKFEVMGSELLFALKSPFVKISMEARRQNGKMAKRK